MTIAKSHVKCESETSSLGPRNSSKLQITVKPSLVELTDLAKKKKKNPHRIPSEITITWEVLAPSPSLAARHTSEIRTSGMVAQLPEFKKFLHFKHVPRIAWNYF